jgi:hypothetical protein
MARRAALIAASLALLALGGCSYGTAADLTPSQERARVAFIEDHGALSDRDFARLCPGLYPRDFLTDHDEWPTGEARSGDLTARQIDATRTREAADLRAAGCEVFPG